MESFFSLRGASFLAIAANNQHTKMKNLRNFLKTKNKVVLVFAIERGRSLLPVSIPVQGQGRQSQWCQGQYQPTRHRPDAGIRINVDPLHESTRAP
jgi:hypothetical protein